MRRWITLTCMIGCVAALVGCNLPVSSTPTVGGVDFIRTSAARTLDAVSTKMAESPRVTLVQTTLPAPVKTTATVPAGTPTPLLTSTPQPGAATSTSAVPCDQVSFVRDISIPDGTLLLPGTAFTKTWELKNSGSCAWNSNYSLVFANEGDAMGGTLTRPLVISGAVQPGELAKISVELKAPAAAGDFKGHWRLRSPAGADFGPGGKSFWVSVRVKPAGKTFLFDNLCSAMWKNGSGDLPCPGKPGDAKGSVSRVAEPKFSTGYQENEPAFMLEPQQVNDGLIVGEFPPYLVSSSATQFRTIIACNFGANACNTRVTITAQAGNEPEQPLGEWNVAYKNDWIVARVDLAPKGLVGKAVVLRYYVRANASSSQNQVLFLSPVFAAP